MRSHWDLTERARGSNKVGCRRRRRWPGPALRPKRSALRAPQGFAAGQANDPHKNKNQSEKGDISNQVRKGTF